MSNIPFDVAGPGVLLVGLGVGLGLLVAWYLVVIVIEAVVLLVMRWAGFWRSLLAAFLMNTLTTLVGFLLAGAFLLTYERWVWVAAYLVAWLLSVVMEWGVLALMDRTKIRRAFAASLVANIITYLGLAFFYFIYSALVS